MSLTSLFVSADLFESLCASKLITNFPKWEWVCSGALPWVGSLAGLGPGWHICCPGETPQTCKTSNLKNLDRIYSLDLDDLDFDCYLHLTSDGQYEYELNSMSAMVGRWEFKPPTLDTGHFWWPFSMIPISKVPLWAVLMSLVYLCKRKLTSVVRPTRQWGPGDPQVKS